MKWRIVIPLFVFSLVLPFQVSAQTALPAVHFIKNISGRGQAYPLSCESRSATDLARYWGISFHEKTFFNALPTSDNPEIGFVGSVFGVWGQTPPKPYGVHARPVANTLREFGLNAYSRTGMTLEELKYEIAHDRPVEVWVVGRVWKGIPTTFTTDSGAEITVAPYEHTMLAYGYDKAGIYLIDAGSGMKKNYSYSTFMASWDVLGNMAVTVNGLLPDIQHYPYDQ